MSRIDPKRFGFAVGTTMALLYFGCAFVMATTGEAATIAFFNSLLHGVDVTSILRDDMPLAEALIGFVEAFVLGWLVGASIAVIYNASLKE